MKALPILLIAGLILFVTGLTAPRKSKRLALDQLGLDRAETKGNRRAGALGDWTARALSWRQRFVAAVSSAGPPDPGSPFERR